MELLFLQTEQNNHNVAVGDLQKNTLMIKLGSDTKKTGQGEIICVIILIKQHKQHMNLSMHLAAFVRRKDRSKNRECVRNERKGIWF